MFLAKIAYKGKQYLVTALWPNEQICPGLQVNVSDSRSLS